MRAHRYVCDSEGEENGGNGDDDGDGEQHELVVCMDSTELSRSNLGFERLREPFRLGLVPPTTTN